MDNPHTLNSLAEQKAQECLSFSFCKTINLKTIKEKIATMLNHIGDNGMFAEYTMHDISHVNGMLNLLEKIIPDTTSNIMTPADWLMIVLAIYFHDLGMHIPTTEYDNRNSNQDYLTARSQMLKNEETKRYIDSLEEDKTDKFLYQEYVRKNHGKRICEWINNCDRKTEEPYKMISEMLAGLDTSFRSDLALICQSHQMDELPEHLKSVDEAYGSSAQEKVNLLYVCILLRSADILHMTHDRTPDDEYRIISPQNKISIIEWAKQKAVRSVDIHHEKDESGKVDRTIQSHSFEIQAKFTDDKGYFSFKTYLDYVIDELKRCHTWCEDSRIINSNQYYFPWYDIDTSRVIAEGFAQNKLKFEIDQNNILKLLTGHTLYNDSTVVLRELIQNAMDAGRLQDSCSKKGSTYQCRVEVSWNSSNRILRVADNATGMDTDDITNYLLKVGASKYQSEVFKKNYPDFHSISRFGIGLLTCFMISDDVDVYTLDEEEKQCHLLKIRNLNGEYLMRNDADVSNIIGGQHGTTFMLKVRPNVDMNDIKRQIGQWVVIPFGEVLLTIDDGAPVKIGYDNVQEAVRAYAKGLNNVDLDSGKYRVFHRSRDGVDVAFLQYYNPIRKVWCLYHYNESDYAPEAPIGISIEGIKVTMNTPGIRRRDYLVLVNCTGRNCPTTNVARNDLEWGKALEYLYRTVYELYIDSYVSQISTLCDDYSLSWATTEINFLIDDFCDTHAFGRFDRRDLMGDVLKKAKCIPVDDGKKIYLASLETLPDSVNTIDSRAFTSAVSLLKDVKATDKTAFGLLSELEKQKINDDIVLLSNAMASCIFNLFLKEYEIVTITADENNRKIKFTWSPKTGGWKHINNPSIRINSHLFVLMNKGEVKIDGMGDKVSICSNRCVYLVQDSSLLKFMKRLINELKVDEYVLEVLSDIICYAFRNHNPKDEQYIDRYIRTEHSYYKKAIFEKFTITELKEALKDCYDSVVDIDKYYHNLYWENGIDVEY